MRKVPHKPFEIWVKQQNTQHRAQPASGIELKTKHTSLHVYRTPQMNLLQRSEG